MYIANPEKSSPFLLHTWKNAPNKRPDEMFAAVPDPRNNTAVEPFRRDPGEKFRQD